MPGLNDLAPLLQAIQGGPPNVSASMPAAMPLPATQIASMPDLPTAPTPMQQTGPSGPVRGKMPWGELMRALTPVLGGLASGGGGPRATGFMQGFQNGAARAAQERDKRQRESQAKQEQAAKFRMEIFEAAREIQDPQEWAKFVDMATDSALQMGLIQEPGEFKRFLEYPAHLETKRKRESALERLESLMKSGYDLDQLAEQNASVQIPSGPRGAMETYKVRDLITIAGALPEAGGKFVAPPRVKPNAPSDQEQSFARYLKGIGKTLDTATSADEMAFKKLVKDSTADPELADLNKSLKQLQIDAAQRKGEGGLPPGTEFSMSERLAKAWTTASGSTREMQRQHALMRTGLQRFRAGDKNGGSQAVLVTFQKILDPTSVVRESEYARTASGQSMLNRFQGYVERLEKGGAGMTDGELAAMVETARQFIGEMQAHSKGQRARIEAQAKKYKLDPATIFDDVLLGGPADAPATDAPAKIYYDANGNPRK